MYAFGIDTFLVFFSEQKTQKYMKRYAIIVAGGSGKRMGTITPKQFLLLMGRPVLMHTIEVFHKFDPEIEIIVVLPESQIEKWKGLCQQYLFDVKHQIAQGGTTRFESVRNGLALIEEDGLVGVHDGVRPLVQTATLNRCYIEAGAYGTAVPVSDSKESVRIVDDKGLSHAVDRTTVRMVQTPQVFKVKILKSAYLQPFQNTFTDDASVVEAAGYNIHLSNGNRENIKITTPDDMIYAEALLAHGLN